MDARNWLKPADHSMAQLERIQATVYNFTLSDAAQIRNKKCLSQQNRSGSEVSLLSAHSTDGPESNLGQKCKSAWGSNSSIPDMIRQQTERQRRTRPESAKVIRSGRPPSGRKGRPHSAKECMHVPVAKDVDFGTINSIGVRGALVEPQQRPPGVSILGEGASGWASAPSHDKDDALEQFCLEQDEILYSAPRASPDSFGFNTPHAHQEADSFKESGAGEEAIPEAPCPSPEPIHFSLPQVAMEDDEEEDFPRMSVDEILEGKKPVVHFEDDVLRTENRRPKSGKVNIRNVKARIDSNLSRRNREACSDEVKSSISNVAREFLEEKPLKPSISTVTVEYFEDLRTEEENKKKKKSKEPEIESMMSKLKLCDEEEEIDDEKKKNYRMTSQTRFDRLDALREKALRVKTVKTLSFGGTEEREVVEDKEVTDIAQNAVKTRVVYVAPKPKVAAKASVQQPQNEVVKPVENEIPPVDCAPVEPPEVTLEQMVEKEEPPTIGLKEAGIEIMPVKHIVQRRRVQSAVTLREKTQIRQRPLSSKSHSDVTSCKEKLMQKQASKYNGPDAYGYSRRQAKEPTPPKVIEIWTRREDFEIETEGLRDCKDMHDQLIDAGVPVTLETLKRGLLPPTEYGFQGEVIKTQVNPRVPMNYTSSLISKPQYWLNTEYKKLQAARKKVRIATQQLLQQELEERKAQQKEKIPDETPKRKIKKKGKRKSKKSASTGSHA
ncbi:hypothetical protein CAPTEDRAFT_189298 [Capitella teleta]|uniref:Uncharacterized protein n=1 Tax=Capitella teleta TaxID=283909 RepID=R7UJD6_CAPTE|nr:hypothetical protein CAPTEDRAFT_189298 [Capitella teleta]|eukprot:ELU06664.1 hypothetical protein CAPTEDRAFT_189298 [Capitella teleta]